ncbi:MAG: 4Fe-4S cluster-binding domain-containing protein [Melioribacteraceae bacterium]|nr:4Fe-4S cluster-binding domain-containing protein [Melioribacteraceae bacterium]
MTIKKVRASKPFLSKDFPSNDIATVVYFTKCNGTCVGCCNEKLRNDVEEFKEFDERELFRHIANFSERKQITHVVISGGEPLHPDNIDVCRALLKILFYYGYKIIIYTGYEITHLIENHITHFHVAKCGKYDETLSQVVIKDDYEMRLPSSNQDFYNSNYQKISNNGILKFKERKDESNN